MPQNTSDWIGYRDAAKILDVSASHVYRSLTTDNKLDPEKADRWWGSGNWRVKPLSERGDLQVRESRARELAATPQPLKGASTGDDSAPPEPGEAPAQ